MLTLSYYFELEFYADDTVIRATCRKPTLLFSYLGAYISGLERWLRERTIVIKVSKSTAINFARAGQRFL